MSQQLLHRHVAATLDTRTILAQGYQHRCSVCTWLLRICLVYTRIYLRPFVVCTQCHSKTSCTLVLRMPQPTVSDRECTETTSRPRQGHARSGVQCAWMSSARRAGWMRALVVILVQRCRIKLRAAPFSEPTYADYASAPSPPPSRARSRSSAPAATAASSVPSDAISGASSPAESTAPLFET